MADTKIFNQNSLPDYEAIKACKDLIYIECRENPWFWLMNYVYTTDAHDKTVDKKRFPALDYLEEITKEWIENVLVLINKSRQMLISWLIVALYLHDTQFFPNRLNFFQSKKEEDADALIERAKIIYDYQPPFLRPFKCDRTYCSLKFPQLGSQIRAVPQGEDQIRMHTASGILIDEGAFIPTLRECLGAAKPTILGGGRITLVSSSNPGYFELIHKDKNL